jgi:hypothetical protein
MTHDDRVMSLAIAITFVLSAVVMLAIVMKSHAIHDRFFAADEPAAAAVDIVAAAAISAEPKPKPESSHRPFDAAAITPFAHYWSSPQHSRHLAIPDPVVAVLADDERALPFEAHDRDRDER